LVSRAFTPARVAALRPTVRALADALAAAFVAAGGGDLFADYAEPLPVAVIGALLGVPDEDLGLLRPWSADICAMFELDPAPDAAARAVRASEEFSAYLRELARIRRAAPRDDLISALGAVVDAGERLTEDELVGTCILLLNAGHEATVNVTANGWLALLRHPDQLARLRAEPALVPGAVEELMRFDTPLQLFSRWAYEDVVVGEAVVPPGSRVGLLFGSANRDPAVFADPDRLDVGRVANPHLSFGAGVHYCLGAPLARLELVESFAALLRHAPALELAGDPRRRPGFVIRGLMSLPLRVVAR
ncbi:cytochrome P450, partial [Luedemannella flava]|uniref:cytochrome P450 n=1 Tax=Luedemannella flava TaxID=349316 RepID=UPI0031D5270E